ncbi:hypothetical protein V6N13_148115 [Hibiscus sabdariffa]
MLQRNGDDISFPVLIENFGDYRPSGRIEELHFYVRVTILYIIGAFIVLSSSSTMPSFYLKFFRDVGKIGKYAWGAAMLAYLYYNLDEMNEEKYIWQFAFYFGTIPTQEEEDVEDDMEDDVDYDEHQDQTRNLLPEEPNDAYDAGVFLSEEQNMGDNEHQDHSLLDYIPAIPPTQGTPLVEEDGHTSALSQKPQLSFVYERRRKRDTR